ncbi:class I SAM-dependent methyltransferase [Longimicrobium sp.]|uniref:class I SAM-dependent methyltransferase n=1 Tax=Longimicrobium sp. TaxID=2029185 RepID=UPI002F953CEE
MTTQARVSRTDTSAVEPRYLAALEAERAGWWNSENFDTWKNLYVSEYARGFYVVDTLQKYVPGFATAGARVLDIGCGDAGVLIAFAERGARCAGIELDEKSLERGRLRAEEHGVEVDLRSGVAEALPWEDASFDLVILDNVLEHVTDREKTLLEIRRVLKPGGLLYMVTPKPFSAYSLWNDPHYDLAGLVLMPRRMQIWYFEKLRGGGEGTYDVGVIPTRPTLKRMLRAAGFSIAVPPRELWVHYLRNRIARPEEVRPGLKRKLAGYFGSRRWPFQNPAMRLMWDVAIGSNFFIARRDP